MLKIPFNNLHHVNQEQRYEIITACERVIDSGRYILGPEVERFEKNLAKYCNQKFAVSCANGTDALILALLSVMDHSDHDIFEVITVANSAPATVMAIIRAGGKPVFVDILPNGLMDITKVKEKITPYTLAIIPVHLYGQILDTLELQLLANTHGIFVIQDAAQAMGSKELSNIPITDMICTSFYPTKNLGAIGDGGAVFVNTNWHQEKIQSLRNYGIQGGAVVFQNGFNSRLDEMQAAILSEKLKTLDFYNEERFTLAKAYKTSLPREVLHRNYEHGENIHLFTIRTEKRVALRNFLANAGVETMIHYPTAACHYGAYRFSTECESLPETHKFCQEILSLPLWPGMSLKEVEYISNLISEFYSKAL